MIIYAIVATKFYPQRPRAFRITDNIGSNFSLSSTFQLTKIVNRSFIFFPCLLISVMPLCVPGPFFLVQPTFIRVENILLRKIFETLSKTKKRNFNCVIGCISTLSIRLKCPEFPSCFETANPAIRKRYFNFWLCCGRSLYSDINLHVFDFINIPLMLVRLLYMSQIHM